MKKVNYHQITLFLTISMLFQMVDVLHGQAQLSLSPNPTLLAQCPNTQYEYILSNFNASCHTIFVEQAASFNPTEFINSDGTTDPTKRRLFITWFDQSSVKGKITITKNSDSECSSAASTKIFEVPIKSLNNLTPTLTPPDTEYNTGIAINISYTAYLEYPMRGPNDPDPLLCTVFNWTLPQGWSLASPPGSATTANITVTTSTTTGGTVSVKGLGTSGCLSSWSNPKNLNITRVLPSPCPITANKQYLVCGSTSPVNFLANETPVLYLDGVTNVVYNWTFPPEWTPNGGTTFSALSLIPDGMTSATINVTATAFGVTSKPCSPINIPYEPINRETAIIATNSTVCTTGTFSLNIVPPTGSTVSWEILPIAPSTIAAVTPSSGTGTSASVSAISNLSGRCKIKFTITNDCGTATRELEFFAGEPMLLDPRVNGMAPEYPSQFPVWYVCPGTHTLTLKAFGGANGNNCVDWTLPSSPPLFVYEACNYLDVAIPVFNQQMGCISFTATLENDCGPNFVTMRLCPRPSWMCQTEFGGNEPGVSLFPNPATDQITIQTIGEDLDRPQIESIQIINTLGNVVKTYTVAPDFEHTIPLFGIPDGTYYVRIQTDYGLVTKSLIVGAPNNGTSRL